MSDELLTRLDHVGRNWMPNRETDVYGLAREAAARIRALEERLTAPPVQRGTTHWEDCWKDRGHHACAVAAVERLQSDLAAARADAERYRWLRDAENEGDDAWFNLIQFGVCDEAFDAYVDEAMASGTREHEAHCAAIADAVARKNDSVAATHAPRREDDGGKGEGEKVG